MYIFSKCVIIYLKIIRLLTLFYFLNIGKFIVLRVESDLVLLSNYPLSIVKRSMNTCEMRIESNFRKLRNIISCY